MTWHPSPCRRATVLSPRTCTHTASGHRTSPARVAHADAHWPPLAFSWWCSRTGSRTQSSPSAARCGVVDASSRAREYPCFVPNLYPSFGPLLPPGVPLPPRRCPRSTTRMAGLVELHSSNTQTRATARTPRRPATLFAFMYFTTRLAATCPRVLAVVLLGERILDVADHRQVTSLCRTGR